MSELRSTASEVKRARRELTPGTFFEGASNGTLQSSRNLGTCQAPAAERSPRRRQGADMKPLRRQFLHLAAGAVALPMLSGPASSRNYPARPVRVIVPFAAGGPTDVYARLIANKLSHQLGQQFYVENIPGGGGNIGTGQAARARPDGYTVLINANNHVINPSLYQKVPYQPFKDFDTVTLGGTFATALAVNSSLPANSLKDLVTLIKTAPGKYSFASPGVGTPSHLLGEQLRVTAGLDMVHVPYGGSGPAVASAVAGHTPIVFAALSAVVPQAKNGSLRVLAVMAKNRSDAFPAAPTIAEAGYPDMDGDGWIGVFVPAATPKEIVALLRDEVVEIMTLGDVMERLATLGFSPIADPSQQFDEQLRIELEKWAKVIRAAKLKAE
jgi:tripartite-type tricarboxylate transporter receptor subunit TctC